LKLFLSSSRDGRRHVFFQGKCIAPFSTNPVRDGAMALLKAGTAKPGDALTVVWPLSLSTVSSTVGVAATYGTTDEIKIAA
jgi:hypothetical protein